MLLEIFFILDGSEVVNDLIIDMVAMRDKVVSNVDCLAEVVPFCCRPDVGWARR